jgi:hypothetical protein
MKMEASEARRALAAAMSTASELDVAVDDAIVLSDSNRIVIRLTPYDAVARATPMTHFASAEQEVELVRRLAQLDSLVAPIDPRVEPRSFLHSGFKIAIWAYFEPVQSRRIPPAEYAQALARLHAGLRRIEVTTRHVMDRVAATQRDAAGRDVTPDLADMDRAQHAARSGAIVNQRGAEQVQHGEPHPFNIFNTKNGPLFIDFETQPVGLSSTTWLGCPARSASIIPTPTKIWSASVCAGRAVGVTLMLWATCRPELAGPIALEVAEGEQLDVGSVLKAGRRGRAGCGWWS